MHDAPAAISAVALDRTDDDAVATPRLFVSCLARAGVYVGGGIAPKILPLVRDGTFMTAFVEKGRMHVAMHNARTVTV